MSVKESYAGKINRKLNKKLHVIDVAAGRAPADLVLKNATYVNVFSNELCHGDIAVAEGLIVGMGEYHGKVEVDVSGITNPGSYTQGGKPNYTAAGVSNSQVNVLNPNPINIQFTVSRRTDRSVPVGASSAAASPRGTRWASSPSPPPKSPSAGRRSWSTRWITCW